MARTKYEEVFFYFKIRDHNLLINQAPFCLNMNSPVYLVFNFLDTFHPLWKVGAKVNEEEE